MSETKEVRKAKTYILKIDDSCSLWGKGYKEIIEFENDTDVWTVDDIELNFLVDKDNTMCISDDNHWIYIPKSALATLKEAIEKFESIDKS